MAGRAGTTGRRLHRATGRPALSRASLRKIALGLLLAAPALGPAHGSSPSANEGVDAAALQATVAELRAAPRGPFSRLRWFCSDGTVHPPKPYPCDEHGGEGVQHGEWNAQVKALRADGYRVANVLADLDPAEFTGPGADLDGLKQILLERFLIGWDDGWIFHGARSYRGALQIEDEEAGSRAVALAMLADPAWRSAPRYFLLREVVRLLPLQQDASSADGVRRQALLLADKDPGFERLRIKIHNAPDASDAASVREYAASEGDEALAEDYASLAEAIDDLYARSSAANEAVALAPRVAHVPLADALRELGGRLALERDAAGRMGTGGRLLGLIRKHFDAVDAPEVALELLQLSLALEAETYSAGTTVVAALAPLTRQQRLELLDRSAEGLYGTGFLSARQLGELKNSLARVGEAPQLYYYRGELKFLARVPQWSGRWIEFHFSPMLAHLTPLEPLVHLYPQTRLRGSPLLFYSSVLDTLLLDANRLAGIEHEIFGQSVGAGLRGLNPGMARGPLRSPSGGDGSIQTDGIYLLPETVSDLPRVAGILTQGEGNSLSHVQLLARNLGIPNVVVGDVLLGEVRSRIGRRAVMAVSPGGVVRLARDGPEWDAIFGEVEKQGEIVIRPDLEKLDLTVTDFPALAALRATDSGRISGPKGANLGELMYAFGDTVPDGFVIPFGVFRELLDQPIDPNGPAVFDWMRERYAAIDAASSEPELQGRITRDFLTRLREWIVAVDAGPEFDAKLRAALAEVTPAGSAGVFVRSDTNVEDLPGFTGAGLNLTVANVSGFEAVREAVHEVWASPFTERAYGWRQAHMEQPEYVFPAVVVQRGFPSEKSGVLVTVDVDTGAKGWLSVAINEGVGGAVDGQAAESLRIDTETGATFLLAQATAPYRRVLAPDGGVDKLPASGTEGVLTPGEAQVLIDFARQVPVRFPSLRNAAGEPLPADVEFGFRGGRLALLQMRPFVESKGASANRYLIDLDEAFDARAGLVVDLGVPPGGTTQLGATP